MISQRLSQALQIVAQTNPTESKIINEEINNILNRVIYLLNNNKNDSTERNRVVEDIKLSVHFKELVLDEREQHLKRMDERVNRKIRVLQQLEKSPNDII